MTMTIPSATVVHRQAFHYATRSWNEPIESWCMRLRTLAEPCLFGDNYEAFLLNKLVVDIREDGTDSMQMVEQGWSIKSFEINVKPDIDCDENTVSYIEPICIEDVKDESADMTEFAQPNNSDIRETFIISFEDTKMTMDDGCAKETNQYPAMTKTNRNRLKNSHKYSAINSRLDETVTKLKQVRMNPPQTVDRVKKKRTRRFCLWQNPGAFYCEHCPEKKFTFKSGLLRHMENNHIKIALSVCHYCGKSFNVAAYLIKHLKIHSNERPFVCECGQSFVRADKLKRHKNTHLGLKPHACHICDKRYSHRYDLTIHLRTHTGDKPFACKLCDKRFTNPRAVTLHLRNHGEMK